MTRSEMALLASRRAAPLQCQTRGGLTPVLLDVTLWKLLELLTKALRRALAYSLFTGRSTMQLCIDIRRLLWRTVGWLSAHPRSPALRDLGLRLSMARWQLASGVP